MTVMQVVVVTEYGRKAQPTEMPAPDPRPGNVLIKAIAAGMNPIDRGHYAPVPRSALGPGAQRTLIIRGPAGVRPKRPVGDGAAATTGDVLRDLRELP